MTTASQVKELTENQKNQLKNGKLQIRFRTGSWKCKNYVKKLTEELFPKDPATSFTYGADSAFTFLTAKNSTFWKLSNVQFDLPIVML